MKMVFDDESKEVLCSQIRLFSLEFHSFSGFIFYTNCILTPSGFELECYMFFFEGATF